MEKKQTIAEIRERLSQITDPEDAVFAELLQDTRKGIQLEIKRWQNNYQKKIQLLQHQETMLYHENVLSKQGFTTIAGIDEVGRGPLAGPVVAAAVILPEDMPALPINDSKKLSRAVREELYAIIMEKAQVGIGIIDNKVIDSVNIYQATKLAMMQAVNNLNLQPDALLIDAMKLPLAQKQVSLIKGDLNSYSIAAASIVAKVYRDQMMTDYAKEYPHYGFEKNAGYGTKAHLDGLHKYGLTSIHRKSFEPIKTMVRNQ